jgi:hypothetical protein
MNINNFYELCKNGKIKEFKEIIDKPDESIIFVYFNE